MGIQNVRYAYNVDTLKHNEDDIIYIPLNRLETPYQTELAVNWEVVKAYAERIKLGDNIDPVIIGIDYDIHDGHHRYLASKEVDVSHVPCIVGDINPIRRKRAIERYKEVWKSWDESKHPRDLFNDSKVTYGEPLTTDEFMQKDRQGELEKSLSYLQSFFRSNF